MPAPVDASDQECDEMPADVVILATGYRTSMPVLPATEQAALGIGDDGMYLYRYALEPPHMKTDTLHSLARGWRHAYQGKNYYLAHRQQCSDLLMSV